MERAQWGAGQLSRTYEQQGTMATMATMDGATYQLSNTYQRISTHFIIIFKHISFFAA